MKKSLIKWREDGDEEGADPDFLEGGKGGLRREPTPFPKEMRAMAKRVQNMRNQQQVLSLLLIACFYKKSQLGIDQAFFFNITWVHVRGECLPNLEFFP